MECQNNHLKLNPTLIKKTWNKNTTNNGSEAENKHQKR